ncbi:hypothetical protein ACOMHN_065688 [Nucella lapillus]
MQQDNMTNKVATTDDIQNWLQKVEEASSKATEAVLGPEIASSSSPYTIGRQRGRASVRGVSDQAKIQDEAYNEAQDLLNEWLSEKVSLHDDNLEDDPDLREGDPWRKEELGSKARREWDNLLNGNLEELGIDTSTTPRFLKRHEEDDPYANLYDLEEGQAVSTVMKNMLSKELVRENFRRDLGFDDAGKYHDPRTKMELRHQRVKENREKREEYLKRQRKEAEVKKEARLTARQIVMKEQKSKEMKVKREEEEMKKQMAQIRKEMHQARRQEDEERLGKQQEAEEEARLAREELERQMSVEREEILQKEHETTERRKARLAQKQMEKARQAAENLRILHRHFTAWYDVILYRRLCFSKARALADWRLTLRVWTAWRSYTRSQRVTMETRQHEFNVVDENRKAVRAQRHHHLQQLRRHFSAWRHFIGKEQAKRELERAQETTRSKMMNLLTADEMFNQPVRRTAWEEESSLTSPCPSSRPESALSSASTTQRRGHGHGTLSQGWQITRKHAHMSKEELARLMHGETGAPADLDDVSEVSTTEHSDIKIRRRFGTQPWMNRHYVVNNFEHRFTAQQKVLREQQEALKEQQRMIQELKYTQQQQEHQKHLGQISAATSPEKLGTPVPPTASAEAGHDGNDAERKQQRREKPAPSGVITPTVSTRRNQNGGGDTHSDTSGHCASEVTSATTVSSSNTQNSKYLRSLKNMEDRAAERARLKAERDDKRRKAEDERLERLKAEEEELKKQAEEEKLARVQAYREKKRLEKEKEQEKQREQERQRELTSKADAHYLKALMKFRVLLPMKKLVDLASEKLALAQRHYHHVVLRKVVAAWKQHTEELTAEKKQLADNLHGYIAVRRCFHSWKNFKYRMVFLERRAQRHHRETILPKLFEAWRQHTAMEKVAERERVLQADEFHPRSLQRKVFHAWRRLPQELKREVEREKLRKEMRKKVADLLPDFQPLRSVTQSTDSAAW